MKSRSTTSLIAPSINYPSGKVATGINDTSGKFCHWYRWQFAAGLNNTGGNLPPVLTTLRQVCHRCSVTDTDGNLWEQYQIANTSKWTWRKKFIYMLTVLPIGVITKQSKLVTEDFFHLPLVSTTSVAFLELRISPRIFEKIWNGPCGVLRGLGETDSWKKTWSHKSRGTVPLTFRVASSAYV